MSSVRVAKNGPESRASAFLAPSVEGWRGEDDALPGSSLEFRGAPKQPGGIPAYSDLSSFSTLLFVGARILTPAAVLGAPAHRLGQSCLSRAFLPGIESGLARPIETEAA